MQKEGIFCLNPRDKSCVICLYGLTQASHQACYTLQRNGSGCSSQLNRQEASPNVMTNRRLSGQSGLVWYLS